jgi:hypothetical protein
VIADVRVRADAALERLAADAQWIPVHRLARLDRPPFLTHTAKVELIEPDVSTRRRDGEEKQTVATEVIRMTSRYLVSDSLQCLATCSLHWPYSRSCI